MADWSLFGKAFNSSWSSTITVASSANANEYGAWVQAVASLPYDSIIVPQILIYSATADFLLDVGVGAAGSEVVLVNGLLKSYFTAGSQHASVFPLPIIVPAGTRVSFRCASHTGSRTLYCILGAIYVGHFAKELYCTMSDTYGNVLADTGGTSIDPGASAGVKGNWTELISSTLRASKAFALCIGNQINLTRSVYEWRLDIAVGAAGSEIIIVADFGLYTTTASDSVGPHMSPVFPIPIPIGTKISARVSCSGNDATDRLVDIVLYTFS